MRLVICVDMSISTNADWLVKTAVMVVVNSKVPRLFSLAGVIGDIQRLQARYTSKCKVPNERGKQRFRKTLQAVIGI